MPTWFTRARRRAALPAAAAALALLLGGCSTGGGDGDAAGGGAGEGGAFPVSIRSALGTAKIEDRPERVVTLGQGSAETATALGNTPVGIESYPWGSDRTGYLPWIHEAVKR